jgi:hypothetical protein
LASVSEGLGKFLGITPINITKEQLEELREFMKSPKASVWVKDSKLKRLVGSWCAVCGDIPTQIATYDYCGATKKERYCSKCAAKQFGRSEQ